MNDHADVDVVAQKSRHITVLVQRLKVALCNPAENLDRINNIIDEINMLTIPRYYVAVQDGLLYAIHIAYKGSSFDRPHVRVATTVKHAADVMWDYDPLNKAWQIVKNRTDMTADELKRPSFPLMGR